MLSHLLRLSLITITTAFVWGCVGTYKTVEFKDTLRKSKTTQKPGTEKKYSVSEVRELDGNTDGIHLVTNPFHEGVSESSELDGNMVLALRQGKTCAITKRKTLNRKMVTVRTVKPGERWKIPLIYALGVVGTSLLITGLALDGPYERTLSEEERLASEDPDVDSELTGKGGLTIVGAIAAPAMLWAFVESARTADTKKNMGTVFKNEHLGEKDCHAGPVVDEGVRLIKGSGYYSQVGRKGIRLTTNKAGKIEVPAQDLVAAFCPDADDSRYHIQFTDESLVDVTEYIHPLCSEANTQRDQEAILEVVDRDLDVVGDQLLSGDWRAARKSLASLKPVSDEQRERVTIFRSQLVDLILKSVTVQIDAWNLRTARGYLESLELEEFDLDAEQEKLATTLRKKVDKKWRKFIQREAREQKKIEKERRKLERISPQQRPSDIELIRETQSILGEVFALSEQYEKNEVKLLKLFDELTSYSPETTASNRSTASRVIMLCDNKIPRLATAQESILDSTILILPRINEKVRLLETYDSPRVKKFLSVLNKGDALATLDADLRKGRRSISNVILKVNEGCGQVKAGLSGMEKNERRKRAKKKSGYPRVVTREKFSQIQVGHSYQKVVAIIGTEGELDFQATNISVYSWQNSDGIGVITVTFIDNAVSSKAQMLL